MGREYLRRAVRLERRGRGDDAEETAVDFAPKKRDFDELPDAPRSRVLLDAAPPAWHAFLDSLELADDEIALLAEWFGYCLTADTAQQKALMLIGPRRSGKGTILRVLRALVGEANACRTTLAGIGGNFGLAPLLG